MYIYGSTLESRKKNFPDEIQLEQAKILRFYGFLLDLTHAIAF